MDDIETCFYQYLNTMCQRARAAFHDEAACAALEKRREAAKKECKAGLGSADFLLAQNWVSSQHAVDQGEGTFLYQEGFRNSVALLARLCSQYPGPTALWGEEVPLP